MKPKVISGILFVLLAACLEAIACDIHINTIGEKKPKYANGEELIVKVEVVLTHKNCPENLDKTKFVLDGLKVLGQTKWIEKGTGVWERKLKLQVNGSNSGKASLKAERKCDKEGGKALFTVVTG